MPTAVSNLIERYFLPAVTTILEEDESARQYDENSWLFVVLETVTLEFHCSQLKFAPDPAMITASAETRFSTAASPFSSTVIDAGVCAFAGAPRSITGRDCVEVVSWIAARLSASRVTDAAVSADESVSTSEATFHL